MPHDIAVLDDNFKFIKTLRLDDIIYGTLFRKLVTEGEYPSLGKAKSQDDDITFMPEDVPSLLSDVERLEAYIEGEGLMSQDVKGRCVKFLEQLKEICLIAVKEKRSVDFIAGE